MEEKQQTKERGGNINKYRAHERRKILHRQWEKKRNKEKKVKEKSKQGREERKASEIWSKRNRLLEGKERERQSRRNETETEGGGGGGIRKRKK
jgi:hypothetical protein